MDMDGCNHHRHSKDRLVCDLLASMTDRYAMALYRRIFFPAPVV
jgi:dGTPase